MEDVLESMFPSVRTDDLADEPHGPLIRFAYDSSTHGMMASSNSFGGDGGAGGGRLDMHELRS